MWTLVTMNEKLVTIAIPFYNDEKYLSYAILSVLNQTYKNWELLLIDDGSTDGSLEIAKRFEALDHRIRVIRDRENYGLAVRLNQSVQLSNGEYYARMDADDVMVTTRIERQLNYLTEHPEVNVLGSSAMLIDSQNEVVGSADMSSVITGFMHPTIMAKTEWFRMNPYAEWCRRCQDEELWLRTKSSNIFRNLETPLLFYREQGTISFKKYLSSQKASIDIRKHYKSYNKSFFWMIKSTILLYMRIVLYAFFSVIGKVEFLTNRRKRKEIIYSLRLNEDDLKKSLVPIQ